MIDQMVFLIGNSANTHLFDWTSNSLYVLTSHNIRLQKSRAIFKEKPMFAAFSDLWTRRYEARAVVNMAPRTSMRTPIHRLRLKDVLATLT